MSSPKALARSSQMKNKEITVEHVKVGERRLIVVTPTSFTNSDDKDVSRSVSETSTSETQQTGNADYRSRLMGGIVCRDCGKVFSAQRHLNKRRKIHTGGKPFNCEICNKSFSAAHHVKRHVKFVHKGERPFKCQLCLLTFTQRSGLNNHILKRHAGFIKPSEQEVPKNGKQDRSSKPEGQQPKKC